MRLMPMQYPMLVVLALTAAGCGRRDADVEVHCPPYH